jgi:hypothetical protein
VDRLTALDALTLAWAVLVFLALWLIWPAVALLAAGMGGLAVSVGLYLGKRRQEPE